MAHRVVIVTGCSTGVGLSTAVLLAKDAEDKFKVYATMRNLSKKGELVERGADCIDKTLFVLQMDVCSETSVQATVKHVLEKEGKVDVLINNAGIGCMGPIEDQDIKTIELVYETNVHGTIRTIRAVLPSMKKERKGRIINISSTGGLDGCPFLAAYCSSKYAMEGLSECLAIELSKFNIHVAVVEPGPISTPFFDSSKDTRINGLESDDELTKDLVKKVYNMIKDIQKTEGVVQTSDEVAEHVIKVVKAEKPHLHNITNKVNEGELKKKFVDMTGDTAVERLTRQFFG